MNDPSKQADSYMRIVKRGDEWLVRYSVLIQSDAFVDEGYIMQPLDWIGSDLSYGIETVEQAAWSLLVSNKSCSNRENFPMLDLLASETLVRQSKLLKDGWSIQIFRGTGIEAWFAVCGHEDMFNERPFRFSRGVGNDDMAVAISSLRVARACEAVEYNRETKHHIIPRDENGDYIKYTPEERERRKPIERARWLRARGNFEEWDGYQAWKNEILNFTRKKSLDRVD